jgi:ABC-type cobalamin transport system permease subunit
MPFKLQVIQVTLQALSSFAIAGGLIFTAIQFRQARKAQLVANFSKLVELQYQLRYIRVQNPALA